MSGTDELPVATGSLDDALAAALADVVRGTGASIGGVYLIEEGEQVLSLVALSGLPADFTAPWRRLSLSAPVPVADAIRDDRLVWVADQDEMARRYPRAAAVLPYGFALAAVPLTGVRRCWGGIVLMWPGDRPRQTTPRERGRLTAGTHRMARLLDDSPVPPSYPERPRSVPAHAMRQPAQTGPAGADYLERLPEGAVSLDLEGRVTFVTTTAAELLGRSADQLLGTRPWQSLPWLDDPVYEDHYRTAVVSRAPVSFTACRPPDHWLTFQLYPDTSGISVRVVPQGDRTPDMPAPAPARHRAQATTGRLYQLVHLAAALTEVVTVSDLVALIVDQILPAFGAQGLVLSAADAGRLKIIGYHGYADAVMERLDALPLDTDLTPAGPVLAGGVPAFFASPGELTASHPKAPQISGKQAWAFLPLIIVGRPVGCCILSYDRPHTFTADERAVLTPLSGLIAQALDRARLYDTKHRLVNELQQALLPRALPKVAGLDVAARYLPAGHGLAVGGDFYDVLRLDDSTAAAVVGDVEGHSVAAAALMGQVRTAVHAHAAAGARPDQVLVRTNRLLADLESDLLVSCLYAHVDLAGGQVTLASAGHVPPLLRRAAQDARVLQVEPGPLLGIDTDVRYPVTRADLPAGAVLALYTDGLVEIPGTDATRATYELAARLATADDRDLDRLLDALVGRTAPAGQHADDITVLLLRPTVGHRLPEDSFAAR
ncbi:SpoIIE family protein phosphatase [Streptomyces sp. S.PNR 29]|uniref:SpoIIE family protein phosphatase n=1 Tax=Streptomyces sp. S.PNR 29 TaxID=2973805 RepID=UPI0025B10D41|nr:SpoIIE family protein phosphatase [Streptomyces sp. S.PNR 29]MDN0199870.1 SpoIIE family protein phosphatase [Streptomyces sp. S.PNR 29]